MNTNRHYYLKQYIFWKCQNLIRWIELIMCIICLSLAIVVYSAILHIVTKILLLTVATTFLFITFLDVVSWWQLRPIGYKTWIMIAIAAFLMFWLCGGFLLLVKRRTQKILLIFTCIFNLLTGLIYLLECFRLIKVYICWTSRSKVAPVRSGVDKSVSTCFLFEVNDLECPKMKRRKDRHAVTVKSKKASTTSYGGTFPVSRDLTPLPSPDTTGKGRKDSGNPYRRKQTTTPSQQLDIYELSQKISTQSKETLKPKENIILRKIKESRSTQNYDIIKRSKEENDLYSIPNSFKKIMFQSRRKRKPFSRSNKENNEPKIIQNLCTQLDYKSMVYSELKSAEKTKKKIISTKTKM